MTPDELEAILSTLLSELDTACRSFAPRGMAIFLMLAPCEHESPTPVKYGTNMGQQQCIASLEKAIARIKSRLNSEGEQLNG